jgi:SAM-dependent methyltransferase
VPKLSLEREEKNCSERTLKRKIGEGSFVGFKKISSAEESVELMKHLRAYKLAQTFSQDQSVLDLGCGVGYGANELSINAKSVIGVDLWKSGLSYCNKIYGTVVQPTVASGTSIPFKDDSFDLVVSFQVIEHIRSDRVIDYLSEIRRVLLPGGTFLVATPNKLLRLLPFQKPWNPDHTKEYSATELRAVLSQIFDDVSIMGLSATKLPYLVEYDRVKQSPLRVYVYGLLGLLMRQFLPNIRIPIQNSSNKKPSMKKDACESSFSIDNFKITERDLRSCIDLYGVCKKC